MGMVNWIRRRLEWRRAQKQQARDEAQPRVAGWEYIPVRPVPQSVRDAYLQAEAERRRERRERRERLEANPRIGYIESVEYATNEPWDWRNTYAAPAVDNHATSGGDFGGAGASTSYDCDPGDCGSGDCGGGDGGGCGGGD